MSSGVLYFAKVALKVRSAISATLGASAAVARRNKQLLGSNDDIECIQRVAEPNRRAILALLPTDTTSMGELPFARAAGPRQSIEFRQR
jgi:hypothetical protein